MDEYYWCMTYNLCDLMCHRGDEEIQARGLREGVQSNKLKLKESPTTLAAENIQSTWHISGVVKTTCTAIQRTGTNYLQKLLLPHRRGMTDIYAYLFIHLLFDITVLYNIHAGMDHRTQPNCLMFQIQQVYKELSP